MNSNKRWTVDNIPDLSGKISIVTGSSSGIGYEAGRLMANKNATVILAVRNLEKGEKAKLKILNQNKSSDVEVMKIDLSDLDSIQKFVENYKMKYNRLDILINNAGVMIPPYTKTKDGFELQMGTNHLGHFALTLQLIDIIESTTNSRIVNVSSGAHKFGNIEFDDLNWEERKYKAWKAYGDSKIANLYFTKELAKRMSQKDKRVLVTASHPGWTATELQRYSGLLEFLTKFFAMPSEQGALTTLRATFDEDAENGDYYGPDGFQEWRGYPVKVEMNALAKDEYIAKRLWDISEKLTDVKFNLN